jgi:ABC-2 type transport system ATP-binding protein
MPDPVQDLPPDPGPPPAIVTRGLTKRFGERLAIDHVDLEVPAGCAFGFLGPNGAGKTTLIRMLLGLTSATEGSASLLGLPVPAQRAQALARVGAIVEEPRFHLHLSGRENLEIVAAVRGRAAYRRIEPSLQRVGLAPRADDKVGGYSLGMRQRLGVARCLLADPQLLILDEPTNGLDPAGIQEFREMIRAFVRDEGRTVFVSSHLLDEVERVCDLVAIVDQGRVIAQGPINELTSRTARREYIVEVDDPSAAALLLDGHRHVIDVSLQGAALRVVVDEHPTAPAQINAALVADGIAVMRLEPVRHSLEERFFALTSMPEHPMEVTR